MIYTLTFNPAIDYLLWTDRIIPGETNRSKREEIHFGGKGINVSVVLAHLGIPTTALGFTAGFTGEALEQAVARRGIRCDFIRLPQGATRINVKLKGEQETEINAQGPEIDGESLKKLYDKLDSVQRGDTLVLAGSVPQSLPSDVYEEILSRLEGRGVRFVVDATGALLMNALKYRPFLIKPNRAELEEVCGRRLDSEEKIAEAALELRTRGAVNVLVSLGKDGALLADEQGIIRRQKGLPGKVINTVGAGDSMVAGFLAGIDRGYEYALRLGSAAGSATAFASGLATKEAIMELMESSH